MPELSEERFARETGVEARVAAIVEPILDIAGYRLVRIRLSGLNGATLQIMAERPDGTMSVDDCEEVSRLISPALDVDDPIGKAYHLEISSPGIDRPMVRPADFARWQGHLLKLDTAGPVAGKRKFRGRIVAAGPSGFTLERDQIVYGDDEPTVEVPYELVSDARLVLTDDLVRDALRQDKKVRKERKEQRRRRDDAGDTTQ